MSGDAGTTASSTDDEKRFAELADELLVAIVDGFPLWMWRTVAARATKSGIALDSVNRDRVESVGRTLAESLRPRLEASLQADVDTAAPSPLAVIRSATGPLNDLLDDLGVVPPNRDEFLVNRFPDDRHDVGPASFADLDESVHGPGLVWGAARAHIHLTRRR